MWLLPKDTNWTSVSHCYIRIFGEHHTCWKNCLFITICTLMYYIYIWGFPRMGDAQNGWFIVENPIKMNDLDFFGTPLLGNLHWSSHTERGLRQIFRISTEYPGSIAASPTNLLRLFTSKLRKRLGQLQGVPVRSPRCFVTRWTRVYGDRLTRLNGDYIWLL